MLAASPPAPVTPRLQTALSLANHRRGSARIRPCRTACGRTTPSVLLRAGPLARRGLTGASLDLSAGRCRGRLSIRSRTSDPAVHDLATRKSPLLLIHGVPRAPHSAVTQDEDVLGIPRRCQPPRPAAMGTLLVVLPLLLQQCPAPFLLLNGELLLGLLVLADALCHLVLGGRRGRQDVGGLSLACQVHLLPQSLNLPLLLAALLQFGLLPDFALVGGLRLPQLLLVPEGRRVEELLRDEAASLAAHTLERAEVGDLGQAHGIAGRHGPRPQRAQPPDEGDARGSNAAAAAT
mmetsp:Transcript_102700/g.306771  ORF Transcript_102700/g.306771 Transcript_102700/m.306771 type:complete len:292 (+) Transcript_102700:223-1098(+)